MKTGVTQRSINEALRLLKDFKEKSELGKYTSLTMIPNYFNRNKYYQAMLELGVIKKENGLYVYKQGNPTKVMARKVALKMHELNKSKQQKQKENKELKEKVINILEKKTVKPTVKKKSAKKSIKIKLFGITIYSYEQN